jgi:uncharacterized OB-fold protein
MTEIRAYQHIYYEGLKGGKIKGVRCERCGTYLCPPRPTCQKCGSWDLEVTEMSGKAKLLFATVDVSGSASVAFHLGGAEMIPYIAGIVKFEEGPIMFAPITIPGFDFSRPEALWEKSGMELKAEIVKKTNSYMLWFTPS